jgi:hypothetical protein
MAQRRSAPVPGRSNVKERISLGKQGRVRAVGACCARGRVRSNVFHPASLVVVRPGPTFAKFYLMTECLNVH